MLLPVRSIGVRPGVLGFFALGLIGALGGLSPPVCCQRAVLGAGVAYLTATTAMRAVNAILVQAVIADQGKEMEKSGDSQK